MHRWCLRVEDLVRQFEEVLGQLGAANELDDLVAKRNGIPASEVETAGSGIKRSMSLGSFNK